MTEDFCPRCAIKLDDYRISMKIDVKKPLEYFREDITVPLHPNKKGIVHVNHRVWVCFDCALDFSTRFRVRSRSLVRLLPRKQIDASHSPNKKASSDIFV
uniref:Uncharacterized protein n=1 Tax=Clandestinovirus TaxID=2831644 RepID=A0A8F8KRU7_9VIRU|nr:hypothetical protein KOM_12_559 [Clandestinovirus]